MGGDGIDDKTNTECEVAIEVGVKTITHFADDRRNSRVIFIAQRKDVGGAQKHHKTSTQMRKSHVVVLLALSWPMFPIIKSDFLVFPIIINTKSLLWKENVLPNIRWSSIHSLDAHLQRGKIGKRQKRKNSLDCQHSQEFYGFHRPGSQIQDGDVQILRHEDRVPFQRYGTFVIYSVQFCSWGRRTSKQGKAS